MSASDNPRIIGTPEGIQLPEAAGQTFKSHQLYYLDSSGEVTAAASDPSLVHGIVMEDASGTETTSLECQELLPGMLVEITYTGTGTPVVGKGYGIAVASNKCKLDIAETTTKLLVVREILNTTTKRCTARWMPTLAQSVMGS